MRAEFESVTEAIAALSTSEGVVLGGTVRWRVWNDAGNVVEQGVGPRPENGQERWHDGRCTDERCVGVMDWTEPGDRNAEG